MDAGLFSLVAEAYFGVPGMLRHLAMYLRNAILLPLLDPAGTKAGFLDLQVSSRPFCGQ